MEMKNQSKSIWLDIMKRVFNFTENLRIYEQNNDGKRRKR